MAASRTKDEAATPPSPRRARFARALGFALAVPVAFVVLLFGILSTPIGKRALIEQIARYQTESGLSVSIGRIEGQIYSAAVLHDVTLSDPQGVFARAPQVALDWRPLQWFSRGLVIHDLTVRRARLERLPRLRETESDERLLPDFDIRVDRLRVERLQIAPGVFGEAPQSADLRAQLRLERGRALVRATGLFSGTDRIALALDAEPERNRFALDFDLAAKKDGAIARLLGARADYRARIKGKGDWRRWLGHLYIARAGERMVGLRISNRSGRFALLGLIEPRGAIGGALGRMLARRAALQSELRWSEGRLDGELALDSSGARLRAKGAVDYADERFDDIAFALSRLDPNLLGSGARFEGLRIAGRLDGPWRAPRLRHAILAERVDLGDLAFVGLSQSGVAERGEDGWTIPLALASRAIDSPLDAIDSELKGARVRGNLRLSGQRLSGESLALTLDHARARVDLQSDLSRASFTLWGPLTLDNFSVEGIGRFDARLAADLKLGGGRPFALEMRGKGAVRRLANDALARIAGGPLRFDGAIAAQGAQGVRIKALALAAPNLDLALSGRVIGGRTKVEGRGAHRQYGPFTLEAALSGGLEGARLVLAAPIEGTGLREVALTIAPRGEALDIDAEGHSPLGRFEGQLALRDGEEGESLLEVERLRVSQSEIAGTLAIVEQGVRGRLTLSRGGTNGYLTLAPKDGRQSFELDLALRNARFEGAPTIAIARGKLALEGALGRQGLFLDGTLDGEGLTIGQLFLARFAARGALDDGRGKIKASLAGRRGSDFALSIDADLAPGRIAAIAAGSYGARKIAMKRRAVFRRLDEGGWRLEPTQISVGEGALVASGEWSSNRNRLDLALARLPMQLIELARSDWTLGGTASGTISYAREAGAMPQGEARLKIASLSRAGLLLASRPIDIALVARLGGGRASARAVFSDMGAPIGRMQAALGPIEPSADISASLQRAPLRAQLRFRGRAEQLWRLAAIDAFDFTGPVALAADVSGSLRDPQVRGSLSAKSLRLQSAVSGTDIRNLRLDARFVGSRLRITRFFGRSRGGGTVEGSGVVDLAAIGPGRGPKIDLKVAARRARLLDAAGIEAKVSGPIRIRSDGQGGTIAARLRIDRALWTLGKASASENLPEIAVRELNRPADLALPPASGAPWRYLIDARGSDRLVVRGMGLESEWGADLKIRGTTRDPRIGGSARLVRGTYDFAGTRFDLTRGRILFDVATPINPRLDIAAESNRSGLAVTITIRGRAMAPQIALSSSPPYPEEEILARLLFGESVASLSATDALQLGAALASLRGGEGLDPINRLRRSIGLDRLRIVSADPVVGNDTAIAAGKNLGRRVYVELVTDGRGYRASTIEYRVTSWLKLLASVSTIGRQNVLVEVSKDY